MTLQVIDSGLPLRHLIAQQFTQPERRTNMTEQVSTARKWSIEGFKAFWANPQPSIVPLFGESATHDIVCHWRRPIGIVRGAAAYVPVIESILRVCPNLSLSVMEYARSEDL